MGNCFGSKPKPPKPVLPPGREERETPSNLTPAPPKTEEKPREPEPFTRSFTRPNPSPKAPDILVPTNPIVPPKPKPAPGSYNPTRSITVKVEDLRLQTQTFETTPGMKVKDLYAQMQGKTGRSISDFVLFFTGRLLPVEEDGTIGEYGVTADSTLDLINKPKA